MNLIKLNNNCFKRNSIQLLLKKFCENRILININIRKMTTNKKNIEINTKSIDKQNFKSREELKEIQLTVYENRFHETRHLLAINPNIFKEFLTQECIKNNETSDVFVDKFNKIHIICEIYNNLLNKTLRVPSKLTNDSIKQLLELDSIQIRKQLNFLFQIEFKRWYEKQLRKEGFYFTFD
jgi:hypothetical protein